MAEGLDFAEPLEDRESSDDREMPEEAVTKSEPETAAGAPGDGDLAAAVHRIRAGIAGLREDWAERYGEVVCEVDVQAAGPVDSDGIRLTGRVLVPSQRRALGELAEGLAGGQPVENRIETLGELDTCLAWAGPAGQCVDVHARPEGDLASQVLPDDPPLRVLLRRGAWSAVELADGTLGWARQSALVDLDPASQPESAQAWRADWRGGWREPEAGAWRVALAPWLGSPYRWGGSSPEGIDCSALTQRVYRQVAGIGLPKHSRDQVRAGRRVTRQDLRPGDLVYLTHRRRRVPHVGIVLDGDHLPIANASFDADAVQIEPLDAMLERYLFRGARRFDRYPGDGRPDAPPRRRQRPARVPVVGGRRTDPSRIPASRRAAWDALLAWRDRSVHVLGLAGTEGAAILRFLASLGFSELTAHDLQPPDRIEAAFLESHVGLPRAARKALWQEIEALPMERRLGDDYLAGVEEADLIFAPQAWYLYPANLPLLAELEAAGKPFKGLMDLYFDLAPAGILAVTGSNGKSTTSRLIETILRQGDRGIYYAGNERRSVQVLDRMAGMQPEDWLVLEVSNRHLKAIRPRPRIAVVTNVLPNHLEEHGGRFEDYVAVKERLVAQQAGDDLAVLNLDNPATAEMAGRAPGRVYPFRLAGELARGAWIDEAGHLRLRRDPGGPALDAGPIDAARIIGRHNRENILAAAMASHLAGATIEEIARGIRVFRGLRHRIQHVWTAEGVRYYDDLNSTTPQATIAALEALPAGTIWIAGGEDKGLDFEPLARLAGRRCRRTILLPGSGSDRLAEALGRAAPDLELHRLADFRQAVELGVSLARPGEAVLLSPACPYFFRMHYRQEGGRERGFKALLREITLDPEARRAGSASADPGSRPASGPHDEESEDR